MNHYLIENIKIKQKPNKFWYAEIIACDNNVRPLRPFKFTFGFDECLTKAQIEQELLFAYYIGNYQGGNNRFCKTIKNLPSQIRYTDFLFDKKIQKIHNRKDLNKVEKFNLSLEVENKQIKYLKSAIYNFFKKK